MGRQVGLALAEDDLDPFLEAITATDAALVNNIVSQHTNEPTFVTALIGDATFFYLVPTSIELRVKINYHGLQKYRPNIGESYLVEFWKPVITGTRMHPGRLYYEPRPFVGGEFVEKDSGFVKWAERILSRARRALHRDVKTGVYVGRHALQMISEGVISLAP